MNPIDIRNETWDSLKSRVTGLRYMVLEAFRVHGRGTTREVASRAGMDILTFRPRATELVDLGFLRCVSQNGHEGVYEAISDTEARERFARMKEGTSIQQELSL